MDESKKIDNKIFDSLLYLSRLSASSDSEYEVLKGQIGSIVDYFEELEQFKGEKLENTDSFNSEKDLRGNSSTSYIDQHLLKMINAEFMDGYFRSPKVLGSS